MSDEDKKKRRSNETARRIWLAGIGAYGRAFTEAQGALKEVTGKSSDVFDELVQKGEMIEKVVEYKGRELLDKTKAGEIEVPSLEIDERIKRMRARLSMAASGHSGTETNHDISDRLDEIEAKIEALDARVAALEPKKATTGRKPVVRKKTSAKTQRTSKPSSSD